MGSLKHTHAYPLNTVFDTLGLIHGQSKHAHTGLPPPTPSRPAAPLNPFFPSPFLPHPTLRASPTSRNASINIYTQIDGVEKNGPRTFLSSFKVSALIPAAVDDTGGGAVAMVAMVFSVARDGPAAGGEEVGTKMDHGETAELVVVLKRKGGDYHR